MFPCQFFEHNRRCIVLSVTVTSLLTHACIHKHMHTETQRKRETEIWKYIFLKMFFCGLTVLTVIIILNSEGIPLFAIPCHYGMYYIIYYGSLVYSINSALYQHFVLYSYLNQCDSTKIKYKTCPGTIRNTKR